MNEAVKKYWDEKIRRWSESSYGAEPTQINPLDRLFNHLRKSVDARMQTAIQTLAPHIRDRSVLDIGGGAGLLGLELLKHGCAHYVCLDISPVAVEHARKQADENRLSDKMEFICADLTQMKALPTADIVVGLGLLDWLRIEEVDRLMGKIQGRQFLLTYSEQDNSLAEIAHRIYLVKRLQWKKSGVYAWHFTRRQMEEILHRNGFADVERIKTKAMRFGVMLHNLNQAGKIDASH